MQRLSSTVPPGRRYRSVAEPDTNTWTDVLINRCHAPHHSSQKVWTKSVEWIDVQDAIIIPEEGPKSRQNGPEAILVARQIYEVRWHHLGGVGLGNFLGVTGGMKGATVVELRLVMLA